MTIRALCCALALLAACPAGAQEISAADQQVVAELLRATGAMAGFRRMATLAFEQQVKLSSPDLSPEVMKIVREEYEAVLDEHSDALMQKFYPIYLKYFTIDEMRALTEFYRSPVGVKAVRLLPTLMQEGARVGAAWAQSLVPIFQQRIQERLRREGLGPAPSAPSPPPSQ